MKKRLNKLKHKDFIGKARPEIFSGEKNFRIKKNTGLGQTLRTSKKEANKPRNPKFRHNFITPNDSKEEEVVICEENEKFNENSSKEGEQKVSFALGNIHSYPLLLKAR